MKTHSLTLSEAHFLDAPPFQVAHLRIYEAEPGDGWGDPFGGFIVAHAGWDGAGTRPGKVALNRGAALVAWRTDRAKTAA